MEILTPQDRFNQLYGATMGVKPSMPLVKQVMQNEHGIDNPVEDLNINKNKLKVIQPTGLVNGSNTGFEFNPVPLLIVSDGKTYRQDHGWTFEGDTATMGTAPSVDLFGLT